MKHLIFSGVLVCALMLSDSVFSQGPDFSFQLQPVQVAGFTGVQSASMGIWEGKIAVLGGRTDGLHRRQPFAAFLPDGNNPQINVMDPAGGTLWSAPVTSLPAPIQEQLLATNLQFTQEGPWLYLTGGYGYSPAADDHITHNKLTVVRLDSLIKAVQAGQPLAPWFRQISDDRFAVTGGQLGLQDGIFYLAGGHLFEGRYNPMNHATFTQTYVTEVRRFTISDDGQNLSVNFMPAWSDPINLHRRDNNMLPQIFPDGRRGFTNFSGVFQQSADLPYLNSVDIDSAGFAVNNDFQHRLNQYHCAHTALYDAERNRMYSVFFGGIAQFYLNADGQLVQDDNVPFVRTIGRVTRFNDGSMLEEKIGDMPALLGAGAEFLRAENLPLIANTDIIDLNALGDDTVLLGYIVGGILSEQPNVFFNNQDLSAASPTLFAVRYVPDDNSTAIKVPRVPSNALDVRVQPNPAREVANVYYTLKQSAIVEIALQAPNGQLIASELLGALPAGEQQFQFRFEKLPAGIYTITLTVGQELIPLKLVVK
jgi:hypothetical protein